MPDFPAFPLPELFHWFDDYRPSTYRHRHRQASSTLRLPSRLARLGGRKFDLLTRSQRVSNAKLRDASSWRPRYPSVREGFAAIVREERVGAK